MPSNVEPRNPYPLNTMSPSPFASVVFSARNRRRKPARRFTVWHAAALVAIVPAIAAALALALL